MNNRFIRTVTLIGEENFLKLKNSSVGIFGIGGVGSYAAESLVRSGVGTVYIYDNDTVALSNINRQIIADDTTVGKLKTEVMGERLKKINPDVKVFENPVFVTPETQIDFLKFDYIIDAVDNVTAKLFLIENAKKHNIPIISVMGTGNKLDTTKLKVSNIEKTNTCPLAKVMRLELKRRGIKNVKVVWSDELPLKPKTEGELKANSRPAPSSMTFVPASAGLLAASEVVKNLISK